MLDISYVVVLGLVCWRITSLLVNEDGPLDIFARFRRRIGVYYDEYSNVHGKNVIARALTCVWCTSVWVAVPLAIFASYSANNRTWIALAQFLFYALSISAMAIVVDNLVGKR